jgi:hypothetical protein
MASGVTARTVLGLLNRLQARVGTSSIFNSIGDPGDGEAIPVNRSGSIVLLIAPETSETNTLANPTFAGQQLSIVAGSVGDDGTRTITSDNSINQNGDIEMSFNAEGDFILLTGVNLGGDLRWRVTANDGVTLTGP